ncbi:hypothetical protein Tco_0717818, partial [Tanacetum coccineum]
GKKGMAYLTLDQYTQLLKDKFPVSIILTTRFVYRSAKRHKVILENSTNSSKGRKNGNRVRGLISLRKHRAKLVYLCKLSRMSRICVVVSTSLDACKAHPQYRPCTGKKKGKRVAELICLKKENKKAMKDDWNDPLEDHYSGLVCRRTTCWGYDFMYPFAGISASLFSIKRRTSMLTLWGKKFAVKINENSNFGKPRSLNYLKYYYFKTDSALFNGDVKLGKIVDRCLSVDTRQLLSRFATC